MSVDISIIICTRNRSDYLARNLESLQNLKTSDGLTHEVLLTDNGSTDKTRDVMNSLVRKKPETYKYNFEPKEGKSNALNLGVQHARGKIVAFTDDDVIVDENWIQALWDTFVEREEIIAVQGRILLQKEIERLPPWADPNHLLFCCHYAPGITPYYGTIVAGANMAFRREAFEKYGRFDPRLGPGTSTIGKRQSSVFASRMPARKYCTSPRPSCFTGMTNNVLRGNTGARGFGEPHTATRS